MWSNRSNKTMLRVNAKITKSSSYYICLIWVCDVMEKILIIIERKWCVPSYEHILKETKWMLDMRNLNLMKKSVWGKHTNREVLVSH